MKPKKLIKQETDYTCGVAVCRMVLDTLLDTEYDNESELIQILNTNDQTGTDCYDLFEAFKDFGLKDCIIETDSNLERCNQLRDEGYMIIMMINIGEPHYSVYAGTVGSHKILLYDPYIGIKSFDRVHFLNAYKGSNKRPEWYSRNNGAHMYKSFIAVKR